MARTHKVFLSQYAVRRWRGIYLNDAKVYSIYVEYITASRRKGRAKGTDKKMEISKGDAEEDEAKTEKK